MLHMISDPNSKTSSAPKEYPVKPVDIGAEEFEQVQLACDEFKRKYEQKVSQMTRALTECMTDLKRDY